MACGTCFETICKCDRIAEAKAAQEWRRNEEIASLTARVEAQAARIDEQG